MSKQERNKSSGATSRPRTQQKVRPQDQPALQTLGQSAVMQDLAAQIKKVAATPASVLIVGESGSGKELVARAIHEHSKRADKPFVPVNCGAIPPSLIEAELFGHEKGSFTGASAQSIGYFEHASGGTIFLDEVTEMPIDMQVQLLRVLESGAFHRVGGLDEVKVDVRVVAATNRDPYAAIADGAFREDLLYRLAVVPLRVPPLRERKDDVEFLANVFLNNFNIAEGKEKQFSKKSLEVLANYDWPGNVRELKNTVHRAYILADDVLDVVQPKPSRKKHESASNSGELKMTVGMPLADAQRELILATLAHHDGDKKLAASTLGISLKTLYNRLGTYQPSAASSAVAHSDA